MLAIRSSEEESTENEEMDTSEPNWCWFYLAECGVWHMFEDEKSVHVRGCGYDPGNTPQMCEVEYMDTDAPWYWHYLADCGTWHRIEEDPDDPLRSENIEQYYLINSKLSFVISRSKFDLSDMLQTDLITGRQRRIKRCYDMEKSCSCFNVPPVLWEDFDPTVPYQLIPLNKCTREYQTVANYIKHGLLDRPIVSIQRIQNVDLWELYWRKKKQLMRIRGLNDIPERRLFHGTDLENVDSICKYNFDLRLAGKNGKLYGKGIYFAKHASYADKYSKPFPWLFPDGRRLTKIMFLARVIVGESVVGHNDFLKPDHGKLINIHDSCVDNISHPTMFVIFDPNQIYPEYLIHYEPK